MKELFDILKPDGTKTGLRKERKLVHTDGDLHGSVHIWVIRDGKVLLQKRSMDKDSFPGCLDVASSGHVDAGEDFLSAAIREVFEEIGLCIGAIDLQPLFFQNLNVDMPVHGRRFVSNEINAVYVLNDNVDLSGLYYQRSEIDALIWMPLKELTQAIKKGDTSYCISSEELYKVLAYVEQCGNQG